MTGKAIPPELRDRPQWVLWRSEKRDGKKTKVPYRAADPNRRASTTDPKTWAPFETALAAQDRADGIGYVFSREDPYAGVDLDACLNEGGDLHEGAAAILRELNSYSERSPSGTGVHAIVRAGLTDSSRNRTGKTPWGGEFETYNSGRYFAMTGARLAGFPATIEDRQQQLDEVLARFFPPPTKEPAAPATVAPLDLDDEELLELARSARNGADFDRLYRGNTDGYGSNSEADMALAGMLAFWCGHDPDRIDRLFRRSGLMRVKWDEARGDTTYGARTIGNALAGRTDFYSPKTQRATKQTSKAQTHSPMGERPNEQSAREPAVSVSEQSLAPRPAEDTPRRLIFQWGHDFVTSERERRPPLLGEPGDVILPAYGFSIFGGPGGGGKSTLVLHLAAHLASAQDWLGFPVPNALKVGIIENEGPKEPYQDKVETFAAGWDGPDFLSNCAFLSVPWGRFSFKDEGLRSELRAFVEDAKLNLLIAGPLDRLGMEGVGSPEDTRAFLELLLGIGLNHDLAVTVLHHFNKSGHQSIVQAISGAWGGHPDALIGVEQDGRNRRTKMTLAKLRWGRDQNRIVLLDWLPDDDGKVGYHVIDTPDSTSVGDANRQRVLEAVLAGQQEAAPIGELLGFTKPTANKHLKALYEAGEIGRRDGPNRAHLYHPLEPENSQDGENEPFHPDLD